MRQKESPYIFALTIITPLPVEHIITNTSFLAFGSLAWFSYLCKIIHTRVKLREQ